MQYIILHNYVRIGVATTEFEVSANFYDIIRSDLLFSDGWNCHPLNEPPLFTLVKSERFTRVKPNTHLASMNGSECTRVHPAECTPSPTPNQTGNALINFKNSENFSLLAPSGPTFIPSITGQSPSTVDLILTNHPSRIHNLHTLSDTPSDHLPVLFSLSGPLSTIRPSPRLDLKNADWNLFRSRLSEYMFVLHIRLVHRNPKTCFR